MFIVIAAQRVPGRQSVSFAHQVRHTPAVCPCGTAQTRETPAVVGSGHSSSVVQGRVQSCPWAPPSVGADPAERHDRSGVHGSDGAQGSKGPENAEASQRVRAKVRAKR